ncbi:MAG: hypothetical protein CBC48_15920 [bacterium TMED88]|nr:hypothetical protein [Deltaproteobacteria bacterium]OUV25870.1 MAG: hypothetical protein CBC48_15920 [bacterium TMED88]
MLNTARALVFLLTLCIGVGVGWALAQGKAGPQPPAPRNLVELERDQALYGELRGLLLEPETLTRVALLSAELSKMGPEDLDSVAAVLESNALGLGQVEAALLVRFWVTYDPEGAAGWATSSRVQVPVRLTVLCALVETWASFDPEAPIPIVDKYLVYPSDLVPPAVLSAFVRGWYASGQPGVLEYLRALEPSKSRSRGLTTYARASLGDVGFDGTAQILLDYPREDYRFRSQLWRYAAPEMLREDREKALAFCSAYCDRFEGAFVRVRLSREWMNEPDVVPLEVMEWLSAAPAGQERDFAVQQALEIWSIDDRESLADWGLELVQAPVEPWLYPGLAIVAAAVAYEDPYQAIELVQQVKPESARNQALARIGTFFIRNDPEEAEVWLTTAGLPSSVVARIRQDSVESPASVEMPVEVPAKPAPSSVGVRPGLRAIRPNSS